MSRFAIEQANAADVVPKAVFTQGKQTLGRVGDREQLAGGPVNALVGGLCRKDDSHQKFKGGAVFEFRGWIRNGLRQPLENLESFE